MNFLLDVQSFFSKNLIEISVTLIVISGFLIMWLPLILIKPKRLFVTYDENSNLYRIPVIVRGSKLRRGRFLEVQIQGGQITLYDQSFNRKTFDISEITLLDCNEKRKYQLTLYCKNGYSYEFYLWDWFDTLLDSANIEKSLTIFLNCKITFSEKLKKYYDTLK